MPLLSASNLYSLEAGVEGIIPQFGIESTPTIWRSAYLGKGRIFGDKTLLASPGYG